MMTLFDLATEAVPIPESAEMRDPIVTSKKYGSRKKLFPFSDEDLKDYRMPGIPATGTLRIVCGTAVCQEDGRLTVAQNGTDRSFLVTDEQRDKIRNLVPGVKVSAVIIDGRCEALKVGPYFGTVSWKLFYGSNKKSATEFIVK